MNLKLDSENSRVVVSYVTENGAAERASDASGNRCPVRIRDEILEINGVSLSVRRKTIKSLSCKIPMNSQD